MEIHLALVSCSTENNCNVEFAVILACHQNIHSNITIKTTSLLQSPLYHGRHGPGQWSRDKRGALITGITCMEQIYMEQIWNISRDALIAR